MSTRKPALLVLMTLVLAISACNLLADVETGNENGSDVPPVPATVTATKELSPPQEITPVPTGENKSVDKWILWTSGIRLRGADLHPCWVNDQGECTKYITRQDIQNLRDLGANLINASYPGIYTQQPPYQINREALQDLDNLITWAEDVGIYVVIHFRTGPGRDENAIQLENGALYDVWTDQAAHDAWIEMWRYTAERYRESPVVLGYNLMVEPHPNTLVDPDFELEPREVQAKLQGTLMDWNAFASDITTAIRQVDLKTPIIVNSLSWGSAEWFSVLQPTGDPRTAYSLHAYDPAVYTHQEEGALIYNYPDTINDYGEIISLDRNWLKNLYKPVREFATQYSVPIYVGEFGIMRWVPDGEAFLEDQIGLFEEYGWNYAYYTWRADSDNWDGFNLEIGPDPGNHTTVPDNPLLSIFKRRWSQNVDFPGMAIEPPTPTDSSSDWWQPGVNTTWQWQLGGEVDPSFDVDMYDVDLFDTEASVVQALKDQGRAVICYISAGSWEDWRPDAAQFPESVIGKNYSGWPGEKWLDVRQIDLLAPIMRARFDECKAKGFDGIEPDNIDAYTNDTGFPLTYEDQLAYNIWLAEESHARGLSIGLKNDPDQVADLLPYYDWALTEDCFDQGWCEQMLPFIEAGKPVFAAEYTDTGISLADFCPQAEAWNISAILKNRDLDAYRESCQ